MMASIGLKWTNQKNFIDDVIGGFVDLINKDLRKKKRKKVEQIKKIVFNSIYNSAELDSIRNGELKFSFGLPPGDDPTPIIAQAVTESIEISDPNFKKSGKVVSGSFRVDIQPSSFFNLLNKSFGQVETEKGLTLPWLNWLLTEGDSIIIASWDVEFGNFGRSGGGHMIEGTGFTINSNFSGTIDNNFVTRSLNSISEDILNILME